MQLLLIRMLRCRRMTSGFSVMLKIRLTMYFLIWSRCSAPMIAHLDWVTRCYLHVLLDCQQTEKLRVPVLTEAQHRVALHPKVRIFFDCF